MWGFATPGQNNFEKLLLVFQINKYSCRILVTFEKITFFVSLMKKDIYHKLLSKLLYTSWLN